MAKRRYYKKESDLERLLESVSALVMIALIWGFITNPGKAIAYLIIFLAVAIATIFLIAWLRKKHFNNLLEKLKSSGQEDYLKRFINVFGLEGKREEGYSFRNHKFDWDRINDLKKALREKGITSSEKDAFALLRFYIQEKEEAFTNEMTRQDPQKLSNLTGPDFELLLHRLFEAMGYKVERTGGVGDQGGDLIAVKDGEKILIQAKRYTNLPTGNDAVQQVVGAMKHYSCNKTMVVTTSYFTPEATVLAKNNGIYLISKKELQELFSKYLKESWV